MFIAPALTLCIILCSQPASFPQLHTLHVRQSRAVLFLCIFLSTVIGGRSACWQNGQLLLVLNSEALLVGMCRLADLFMLPVETLSLSFDAGENLPLPYSSMTSLFRPLSGAVLGGRSQQAFFSYINIHPQLSCCSRLFYCFPPRFKHSVLDRCKQHNLVDTACLSRVVADVVRLQLILPISRTLVTFLLFAFGRACVQRK